jgi:hypothetical protein
VVVLDELTDQMIRVPGSEDQEVVEALVLQGLNEPLNMCVDVRSPDPQPKRLDALTQRAALNSGPKGSPGRA